MNMPKIGLYRHFKGSYYFVQNIVKDAVREVSMCYYYNVCHPEYGLFVRPCSEWFDNYTDKGLIKDREDNVTGQCTRFAVVKDLDFQLSSVSTEQLLAELGRRVDSPIHEVDIEGLRSPVFSKDYVVGEAYEPTEDTPKGVYTVSTHDTLANARRYFESHKRKKNTRIFKRTFIDVTEV